jgi:hypothetical protein
MTEKWTIIVIVILRYKSVHGTVGNVSVEGTTTGSIGHAA